MKLLLLPGMDGTGALFSDLKNAFSSDLTPIIIKYPSNQYLSFYELAGFVKENFPIEERFIIIAESFSVPIAIICAAENPVNLEALILCSGFATSPIKGLKRYLGWMFAPFLFRLPLPNILLNFCLIGENASSMLSLNVKNIVSSIQKNILISRLKNILNCDVRKEIGRIKIPMLYIRAKNDRLINKSCYEEIKTVNSCVELLELDGPHLILQTEPEKSAKHIMEFIKNLVAVQT